MAFFQNGITSSTCTEFEKTDGSARLWNGKYFILKYKTEKKKKKELNK